MKDKVVLVTGATNGIGEVAALELARLGAQVVVISRNAQRCQATVDKIKQATGNPHVSYLAADLALMADTKRLAAEIMAQFPRIDVLLNNAGAYFDSYKTTSEGLEMTFALNHINYFILSNLLLPRLRATAQQYGEARIVNVSSDAHQAGKLNFENLQNKQGYAGFRAYGQSKMMNVLFTYELARRLEGSGVTVNALHPGFVRTGFGQGQGGLLGIMLGFIQRFALTPEQGAATSIYLASSPAVQGVTGKYWDKRQAKKSHSYSYDEAVQKRLWEVSEQIAGVSYPA